MKNKTASVVIFGLIATGLSLSLLFTYQGLRDSKLADSEVLSWPDETNAVAEACAVWCDNIAEKPKCLDRPIAETPDSEMDTPKRVSKTVVKVNSNNSIACKEPASLYHKKISPNASLKASLEKYTLERKGNVDFGGYTYTFTVESFDFSIEKLSFEGRENYESAHSQAHPEQVEGHLGQPPVVLQFWKRLRHSRKTV